MVVDLAIGDIVHWLRLEGVVSELYDCRSTQPKRACFASAAPIYTIAAPCLRTSTECFSADCHAHVAGI